MKLFWQRSLCAFFVFWHVGGVFGAVHRVPLAAHVEAKAYGHAFYLLTDTAVQKLSLSGKTLWTYTRDPHEARMFVAFDTVYLYGEMGLSQLDGVLGVKRWQRSFSEIIGVGHHYPYLVVYMPTQTAYVHPETGVVMALSKPGFDSAVLANVDPLVASASHVIDTRLTDGRTCLEKKDAGWQLKGGDGCHDLLFQFADAQVSENIEAYLWVPPTLSILTPSHILFWPYVGRSPQVLQRDQKN